MTKGAVFFTGFFMLAFVFFSVYGSAGGSVYGRQGGEYAELAENAPSGVSAVRDNASYFIRERADGGGFVVMLPLTDVLHEYADISWDEELGIIEILSGTLGVSMEIGKLAYFVNGEPDFMDAPPEIIDGVPYVTSSFFEKTFGFWITDTGEGIIDLFTPNVLIENI